MFGGSPKWESGRTDAAQQKLAKTTVLEFGELRADTHVLIFLVVLWFQLMLEIDQLLNELRLHS